MRKPRLQKHITKLHFRYLSILLIALLATLIYSYHSTYAETNTKTNVSVEVKQGCSVTAQNNQHSGMISNGTYQEIGEPTEFTIACNGYNQYDVYAIGFTNDEEGNNQLIGDKDSDHKYNIVTGTNQEGITSNWSFMLSDPSAELTLEPDYLDQYTSIPGSSTKVASKLASTVSNTTDTFKSHYAAYISPSQPADTYHGKVKYTLYDNGTVPITNYSITYNAHGGDESSLPYPNPLTGSTLEKSITLSPTIPTKEDTEFAGWCSIDPGESDSCPSGGKVYEAGGSYPLSDGASVTLYATWKSGGGDLGDLGEMQSFTCDKITDPESFGHVTDNRDGNTYTVAKLADGKCWMTQNLRLGDSKLTEKNPSRTLTTSDTDLQSGTYNLPASSQNGFSQSNLAAANIFVPDSESDDIKYTSSYSGEDYTGNLYKMEYGGYYTWVAATAGTGANISEDYENAPSSICPKGWRLPKGSDQNDDNNEFSLLLKAYGGTGNEEMNSDLLAKLLTPSLPNFAHYGLNAESVLRIYNESYWWSSTSCMSDYAYILDLGYSDINPVGFDIRYNIRSNGYTVRCITRQ